MGVTPITHDRYNKIIDDPFNKPHKNTVYRLGFGDDGNICEFQKMYFLPEARGLGLGSKMITDCLQKAKEFGFEKCYLETMPYMDAATALYKKNGFTLLDKPVGNTGHYSCNVWMLKEL